jgi:hypothetical protein
MELDLGRLYWLQGRRLERDGRQRNDRTLLDNAWQKYEQATAVSKEALATFRRMSICDRIAKAIGNLGNAAKQMASFMVRDGRVHEAARLGGQAGKYYEESLTISEGLRKDEVAHALAGLAEVCLLTIGCSSPRQRRGRNRDLLELARKQAKRSHRLYEELAGPPDESPGQTPRRCGPRRRTRDEIRTERLIGRIERRMASL